MLANLATLSCESTPCFCVDELEFIVHHFDCLSVLLSFISSKTTTFEGVVINLFLSDSMKPCFLMSVGPASSSKHIFSLHSTVLKPEHVFFIKAPCLSRSQCIFFHVGFVPVSTHFLCRNLLWKNKYTSVA